MYSTKTAVLKLKDTIQLLVTYCLKGALYSYRKSCSLFQLLQLLNKYVTNFMYLVPENLVSMETNKCILLFYTLLLKSVIF